jgi:hypothetical protein
MNYILEMVNYYSLETLEMVFNKDKKEMMKLLQFMKTSRINFKMIHHPSIVII